MRNYTTKYGNLTKLADNNMEKVKQDIQIHSHLGAAYIKNKTKLLTYDLVIPSTIDILLKTAMKHCSSICWPYIGSTIYGLIGACYKDNFTKHQNRNYIIQCRPMILNHLCITLFSEYDL